jgi:hypothetical protein
MEQQTGRKLNRLTSIEIFKLYGFMDSNKTKWTTADTYESIAVSATEVVGRSVNSANIKDAMQQLGLRLPVREKSDSVRISILKRAVETLYKSLGQELPPEWANL